MTWLCANVTEGYLKLLREVKDNERPVWSDPTRGILVALVQERPTIWNAKARFIKDDVMSSFQQISEVLSKMDTRFNIWAILEKWCWMVELFIRSTSLNPPKEWRYNNSLHFLKEFSSPSYPYLQCISQKRLLELTDQYENEEWKTICESSLQSSQLVPSADFAIFRDEMSFYSGENESLTFKIDAELAAQRLVTTTAPKRRGRPPKVQPAEKKPSYEESNCFKSFRLCDLNNSMDLETIVNRMQNPASRSPEDVKTEMAFDQFGFSTEMYDYLIEKARDRAELWHIRHPDRKNTQLHAVIYEQLATQLLNAFNNPGRVDKFDGDHIKKVWESITDRFYEEEKKETPSNWKHYSQLHFLSHRVMPAFLYDSVYLKNNGPTTSSGSPTGSESRMASSSPVVMPAASSSTSSATATTTIGTHKTIEAVLEQLIAKNRELLATKSAEDAEATSSTISTSATANGLDTVIAYNDLQRLFCNGALGTQMIKQEIDDGQPPTKIGRTTSSPTTENGGPSSSTSSSTTRVTIVNETRATPTAISTWVPPKEDVPTVSSSNGGGPSSSSAGPSSSTTRKEDNKRKENGGGGGLMKNMTTGEKMRKLQQAFGAVVANGRGTSAATANTNGNSTHQSPLTLANPTIAQALLQSNADTVTAVLNNQMVNSKVDVPLLTKFGEKKWHYLSSLVTEMCREVEIRDPVLSCYMFKEIQTILFKYQLKSVTGQSATD